MSEASEPRNLLILALKKAGIREYKIQGPLDPGFTKYYWRETARGDIEVVFLTHHLYTGRLNCSVTVSELANRICRILPQSDVANALTDALEFIKINLILLLPLTDNNLLTRAYNLATESSPRSDKSSLRALFDMMIVPYSDSRAGVEKRLRAERKSRRGGSSPRLPTNQRESLHAQYDFQYARAKTVKKNHDVQFRNFVKERRIKGYTNNEWQQYWMQNAQEFPEELQKYLAMFASRDRPSASEIAYQILAAQTGHTTSYLKRLVTASRKRQKQR